ncbi:hypothetical protein DCC81_00035 [Chitinophaga parva]|uniref:DUF1835 domain-containing protein n=1 Tax=Chitinophaga parva TaxID=2169414 RepID=A0A2T7BJS5_9BACT|nr:hypothetical protein [Chitinophaga parva]PUZ27918.1 hypothetical protein DCC81_00035 [Chitinophaga parva]
MAILHILNGDATLTPFRNSGLPGEIVVNRSMMSEGHTIFTTDMDEFFKARADHAQQVYGIDRKTYLTQVVQEFTRLENVSKYEEVVLWFEFDLFCQINLLFTLFYLQQFRLPPRVSLVAPGPQYQPAGFRGLGMLTAGHFPGLFADRLVLQPQDLGLATEIWSAYCAVTPMRLEPFSGDRQNGQLYHIGPALKAHLQRLPSVQNGLNRIESFFLNLLLVSEYRWYDLYTQFWDQLTIYGFGDFQLDVYLRRMISAGVVDEKGQQLSITGLGRDILNGEENYLRYAARKGRYLGGIPLHDTPWRWDERTQSVVRVG